MVSKGSGGGALGQSGCWTRTVVGVGKSSHSPGQLPCGLNSNQGLGDGGKLTKTPSPAHLLRSKFQRRDWAPRGVLRLQCGLIGQAFSTNLKRKYSISSLYKPFSAHLEGQFTLKKIRLKVGMKIYSVQYNFLTHPIRPPSTRNDEDPYAPVQDLHQEPPACYKHAHQSNPSDPP